VLRARPRCLPCPCRSRCRAHSRARRLASRGRSGGRSDFDPAPMAGAAMSDDTITALAPWQQRIYTQAAAAIDSGRLGHALLFRGPARLGKGAVARALARRLLCESRTPAGDACGRCRGCQLFAAGTHPDFHAVSFITVKDGSRLRTELIVDQMRELSGQLSLTPQYGGAQVAIIDPADALNNAAANA